MTNQDIIDKSAEMVAVYLAVKAEFDNRGVTVPEETLRSLACTVYIQMSKPKKSGGSWSGGGSSYSSKSNGGGKMTIPQGQLRQIGTPCLECGKPLRSGKNNPSFVYCSCWFND